MTIREAAARLGVHESTVRRYADQGLIGVKRLPSGVSRLSKADVDALAGRMESRHRASTRAGAQYSFVVTIEGLDPASVWESDAELEEFLALTCEERDHDR